MKIEVKALTIEKNSSMPQYRNDNLVGYTKESIHADLHINISDGNFINASQKLNINQLSGEMKYKFNQLIKEIEYELNDKKEK